MGLESHARVRRAERLDVTKKNVRIVKGSPLARRMLVKYTVPEPIGDEVIVNRRHRPLPYLCGPSLGR